MKTLQWHSVCSLAVKQAGKWAVHVSNGLTNSDEDDAVFCFIGDRFKEMYGDDPYKDSDLYNAHLSMLLDGLVLFDTEEEMRKFYSVFEHPLADSSAVYACTFSPDGVMLTENT